MSGVLSAGALRDLPEDGSATPFGEVLDGTSGGGSAPRAESLRHLRVRLAHNHGSRLLAHAQRLGNMGWSEWNLNTGETAWSDHMYVIFGRDAEQGPIRLHDLPKHAEPSDRPVLDNLVSRVTRGEQPVHAEFRIRKGGGIRNLRAVLEPAASGVHGIIQDITGRRQAEQIMSESKRQLLEVREQAAEERHITLALRDAILPEPGASLALPYARIAVRYVPAEKAASLGGDWYEAARLPDGRMFLAVGDVSGHGLPAIAEMAQLRHALVGLTMTGASPDRLLAWLNALVLNRLDDTTATVVCGYFDPPTRLFTWAQAGHLPPILVRRGIAGQLAAPHGVVLGATSGVPYTVAETRLEPGDLLLMFSDGLIERRSRDIGDGLALTLQAAGAAAAHHQDDPVTDPGTSLDASLDAGLDARLDARLDAGLDRLIEAIGGPNPEDDTCLLAVSVLGGDRNPGAER
ncbi:SpoIIE family protein phosphatase [Planotetraspora sp. A-T 1434]|uniref:PP2C family protein-serine/threonine phosphatase n=1 Tax=Planotetraspora sp. A-T 1434 TaxID=2979219 RepID=UPI0021BDF0F8|nr:SpoIIE family protein phosphatase [Planotetraspora sp. A-T 1434]MCT9934415.1 SpoIIE family protein phosphatase [Planotetraspora sp. A-T 1434]